MTPTLKGRMATFPLDQLLALGRRGMGVCLFCGEEQRAQPMTRRGQCAECREPYLYHPDEIIVLNLGEKT